MSKSARECEDYHASKAVLLIDVLHWKRIATESGTITTVAAPDVHDEFDPQRRKGLNMELAAPRIVCYVQVDMIERVRYRSGSSVIRTGYPLIGSLLDRVLV